MGSAARGRGAKNYSTQYSRVVPHHSTDCAITSLTSEIRRDPVLSGVYGRSYKVSLHVDTYILRPKKFFRLRRAQGGGEASPLEPPSPPPTLPGPVRGPGGKTKNKKTTREVQ